MRPDPALEEWIQPARWPIETDRFGGDLDFRPPDPFPEVRRRDLPEYLPDRTLLEGALGQSVLEDVLKHHEDERTLFVTDEAVDTPARTSEVAQWTVVQRRVQRNLIDDSPSIPRARLRPALEHPASVVGAEVREPLAPVAVVLVDVDAVAPPGVKQFVVEVAGFGRARCHAHDPRTEEREAGEGEARREEILHHRETLEGVGTEEAGIADEIVLSRVEVEPRLVGVGLRKEETTPTGPWSVATVRWKCPCRLPATATPATGRGVTQVHDGASGRSPSVGSPEATSDQPASFSNRIDIGRSCGRPRTSRGCGCQSLPSERKMPSSAAWARTDWLWIRPGRSPAATSSRWTPRQCMTISAPDRRSGSEGPGPGSISTPSTRIR